MKIVKKICLPSGLELSVLHLRKKKTVAVEYQNIVCVCAYAVRFNITVKLGIG